MKINNGNGKLLALDRRVGVALIQSRERIGVPYRTSRRRRGGLNCSRPTSLVSLFPKLVSFGLLAARDFVVRPANGMNPIVPVVRRRSGLDRDVRDLLFSEEDVHGLTSIGDN